MKSFLKLKNEAVILFINQTLSVYRVNPFFPSMHLTKIGHVAAGDWINVHTEILERFKKSYARM